MDKLLVGSIYPDNSPLSKKWLDIQLRYLKATTKVTFNHISIIQSGDPKNFSSDTEVFVNQKGGRGSTAHIRGLQWLKRVFLERQKNYSHFLFLDMDAFPIRENWDQFLTGKLAGRWDLAVLLRPENLEQRLHSSVIFCKKIVLGELSWEICEVGRDLAGGKENDIKLMPYQEKLRNRAFPLLKSNQHLVHPLLCGIYWDMFYHHSCGTGRKFNMRSGSYWGHILPKETRVQEFTDQLMIDSNGFIKKLAGWKSHVQVPAGTFTK
jgi:hypothetical protein